MFAELILILCFFFQENKSYGVKKLSLSPNYLLAFNGYTYSIKIINS
jgi:hypothetical protein